MTRPPIEAPPCRTCGGDAWFPPERGRSFGTVCEDCLGSGAQPQEPKGGVVFFICVVIVVLPLIYGAAAALARVLGLH